ncbi:hypothetical protein BDV96DRAFT_483642 [Lophiotrema nucula]|uniref:Nucleoporin NUP49/NSP49 n=1 Tax=Lophiotrema nucula TaxID=690887 RepID=A0A6A5ZNV1_9PLEO|nr:hypothetical protein BDV96DRAFT_483642 [Lophiotrema nucula]
MAFGRSNSLSINTSGTLFAGLFGSTIAPSSQPQTAGGLFGSASQPQTGGLFGGSTTAQASQPPQTASLFGQAQASQPQSAGLFGNKPAATGASTGGGLFGGALGGNTQTQNQTQSTSQSGGLFNLGQPPKPASTGLYGASTQQSTAPSLFGNTNAAQNQTGSLGLFGSTQQNQPQQQQQTGLFGGMQSQNKPFGASTLSGVQQPVQTTLDNIKGTTRFVDIHPDVQAQIEMLDNSIQHHISNCSQVREALPATQAAVDSLNPDVAYLEQFLQTTELGLDNDSAQIAQLKGIVRKDADDASLSFRAIRNLQLPAQFHYGNRANLASSTAKTSTTTSNTGDDDDPTIPVDLLSYFGRRADDIFQTLDTYQGQIREIEAHLRTMEAGTVEKAQQLTGSRSGVRDQRRELVEALKAIEGAILEAAKKVGGTRDMVTKETLGNVGAALL